MSSFESEPSQLYKPLPLHNQMSLSSIYPLTVASSGSPALVKMEPYHLAKNIGVGTNLKQVAKAHFSPANIVAPSPHNPHQNQHAGHHISGSNNNYSTASSPSNNPNFSGIPMNLSQTQTATSTTSHEQHAAATIVSHLPTAALAAACPTTAIRGPSQAHHQSSPINGSPYHSSHSPTLPVAHTALPSEIPSTSTSGITTTNRTSPLPLPPSHIVAAIPNSPYHHPHYPTVNFNKIQNLASSSATSTVNESSQSNQNGSQSVLIPQGEPPLNTELVRRQSYSPENDDSSNANANINPTSPKIVSQNMNGTYEVTGIPSNEQELQLFRVMQWANLLKYFDTLVGFGGDDLRQLYECPPAEFLEITHLIGMATKPLHVRRLQKALQEWATRPELFQVPVLPAGYPHYGISRIDRTISHTQVTTTSIAATSGLPATGGVSGQIASHTNSTLPLIPIPHIIHQNPNSPYPAQNAPIYAHEPPRNTVTSQLSNKGEDLPTHNNNNNPTKSLKSHERSNNSSPLLPSNASATATFVGLDKVYNVQRGSPSIPVVISTAQTYNPPGQHGLSSFASSYTAADHLRNCPSPSGSTSSSSSSSLSIKSLHRFHHSSSPLESSPDSPVNSESERSTSSKHEKQASTCTELENSSSVSSDQTNSIQLLDNSTGTGTLRVDSRSSSHCGSEPNSPAPPPTPLSFSRGIQISSSSQQTWDSPRPSTESVTNRNNNSVAVTATTSSQDFSSLQEHEIQKLTEAAMNIVRSIPPHLKEPKLSKKIETSSYEFIRRMAEDDPRRMDEIRRLSAIFGKTGENGKRNKGNSCNSSSSILPSNKTMSILELAMNEAAAQLCKLVPALLTKRDEMFSLAKQVIRDSGLPYAVICANSNLPSSFLGTNANNNSNDGGATSGLMKGKIDDNIRNSPAHQERIIHQFAAACKKVKLDNMQNSEGKDINGQHGSSKKSATFTDGCMRIAELHNPLRKSPTRENKIGTSSKRIGTSDDCRKNRMQSSN